MENTVCAIGQHNSLRVNNTSSVMNRGMGDTPGQRIRDARKSRHMTQAQLAEACGWEDGQSRIGNYERDERYPGRDDWIKLGQVLGVSPAELQFGADSAAATPSFEDGKYVYIPKYQAIGGLGRGRHNEQHVEISGTHAYRRDWILKNGWRPEGLAVFDAEGPSMEPTINDGDVVLANLDDTKIKSGEVYVIEDADQGTRIKRLFKQLDGRIRVVSDNPDKRLYPDDYLTPETGARVIGRVVHRSGAV